MVLLGVPLLGDAAHVTVPGGEGANVAMLDGAELGQAIAAHPGDPETACTTYEEVMFRRGEAEAIAARDIVELISGAGAGAPHDLAELRNGPERTQPGTRAVPRTCQQPPRNG